MHKVLLMKKFLFLFLLSITSSLRCGIAPSQTINVLTSDFSDDTLSHIITSKIIQLDEARIEQLQRYYEPNFKLRKYLKYGFNTALIGLTATLLYQAGFFNHITPQSFKPQIGEVEARLRALELWKQILENKVPEITTLVHNSSNSRLVWLWGGIKNLSWYIAPSLVAAKVMGADSYVKAEPTFGWFFSNHDLTLRIESIKQSVMIITNPAAEKKTKDFHRSAFLFELQTIANEVEEVIAFIGYYFNHHGVVLQPGTDESWVTSMPRYLFNLSNDFMKKVSQLPFQQEPDQSFIGIVEEYKSEMSYCIKWCQWYERDLAKKSK